MCRGSTAEGVLLRFPFVFHFRRETLINCLCKPPLPLPFSTPTECYRIFVCRLSTPFLCLRDYIYPPHLSLSFSFNCFSPRFVIYHPLMPSVALIPSVPFQSERKALTGQLFFKLMAAEVITIHTHAHTTNNNKKHT